MRPRPGQFVLEDANAPANIQVREVRRAPFPHGGPHGSQQPASGAARAALAVGAHVPLGPPGVEHAIKVLTLTTRHGWSLPLNTCAVEHARVTGRQRVSGCYLGACAVTLMLEACFIVPIS